MLGLDGWMASNLYVANRWQPDWSAAWAYLWRLNEFPVATEAARDGFEDTAIHGESVRLFRWGLLVHNTPLAVVDDEAGVLHAHDGAHDLPQGHAIDGRRESRSIMQHWLDSTA